MPRTAHHRAVGMHTEPPAVERRGFAAVEVDEPVRTVKPVASPHRGPRRQVRCCAARPPGDLPGATQVEPTLRQRQPGREVPQRSRPLAPGRSPSGGAPVSPRERQRSAVPSAVLVPRGSGTRRSAAIILRRCARLPAAASLSRRETDHPVLDHQRAVAPARGRTGGVHEARTRQAGRRTRTRSLAMGSSPRSLVAVPAASRSTSAGRAGIRCALRRDEQRRGRMYFCRPAAGAANGVISAGVSHREPPSRRILALQFHGAESRPNRGNLPVSAPRAQLDQRRMDAKGPGPFARRGRPPPGIRRLASCVAPAGRRASGRPPVTSSSRRGRADPS